MSNKKLFPENENCLVRNRPDQEFMHLIDSQSAQPHLVKQAKDAMSYVSELNFILDPASNTIVAVEANTILSETSADKSFLISSKLPHRLFRHSEGPQDPSPCVCATG